MTTPSRIDARSPVATPYDIISAQEEGREPPHQVSLSELAAEAARTGVVDEASESQPRGGTAEDALMQLGDPDVDALDNELIGDQLPGGSNPAPDQNNVDDIGRAYGVTDADAGALLSIEELLERRDRHRWELDPRCKHPTT